MTETYLYGEPVEIDSFISGMAGTRMTSDVIATNLISITAESE